MTWLLDGNVLVALRIQSHIFHEEAHRWYASMIPDHFATCAVTQGTLLRLHMRFARDKSAAAAWRSLHEITSLPNHEFWPDGLAYSDVPCHLVTGASQVTDAWLVELARRHQAKLATFDEPLSLLHPDVAVLIR